MCDSDLKLFFRLPWRITTCMKWVVPYVCYFLCSEQFTEIRVHIIRQISTILLEHLHISFVKTEIYMAVIFLWKERMILVIIFIFYFWIHLVLIVFFNSNITNRYNYTYASIIFTKEEDFYLFLTFILSLSSSLQ